MESRKENASKQAGASLTALSVLAGYVRAMEALDLSNSHEALLGKHIINTAILSEQSYVNWTLEKAIFSLSNEGQRKFFEFIVAYQYDALLFTRKKMVTQQINKSIIDNHVRQVVFLGDGYDMAAFFGSLNHTHINFYALDRGETRQNKLKALETIPHDIELPKFKITQCDNGTVKINDNLHYVECNFIEEDLCETLVANGFNREEKTLVIAEGVTMYLNKQEVSNLLKCAYQLINEHDNFLLSFTTSPPTSKLMNFFVSLSKENYRFHLPMEKVPDFVSQAMFDVSGKMTFKDRFDLLGSSEEIEEFKSYPYKKQEIYYLLEKDSQLLESGKVKNIDSIPTMGFNLSEHNEGKEIDKSDLLIDKPERISCIP